MLRKTNVTCHSHEFLLKDGHLHFLEMWNDTAIGMGPCNKYILCVHVVFVVFVIVRSSRVDI
jgi:hypothetical protein